MMMTRDEIKELRRKLRKSRNEAKKILKLSPVFRMHIAQKEIEASVYGVCLSLAGFSYDERMEILPQITPVSKNVPIFHF